MKLEKRGDAPTENEAPVQNDTPGERYSRKREISVMIYTVILFIVAMALIALSWAIQERSNSTINDLADKHDRITSQAMQNIEELQRENSDLQNKLDAAELLAQLLDTEDPGARQAIIKRLEPMKEYLDEPYLEIYNNYIEKMK